MNDEQLIWESYVTILKEQTNEDQFYIRFGDLPKGDYSQIHTFKEPTYEKGVSCFWARWSEEYQRWVIDGGESENMDNTLDSLMNESRPVYLLKGKQIGYGHDEEPILQKDTIKVLAKLNLNDIFIPESGEQYLEQYPRLSEPYPEWKDLKQKRRYFERVLSHYSRYEGTKMYDMYKKELSKVATEEQERKKEWERSHLLKSNVSPDRFK